MEIKGNLGTSDVSESLNKWGLIENLIIDAIENDKEVVLDYLGLRDNLFSYRVWSNWAGIEKNEIIFQTSGCSFPRNIILASFSNVKYEDKETVLIIYAK